MSTLTASSLSQETSRLDRAAADRSRRPAEGGAGPGEGFAGLLRAAGVQARPDAVDATGAARADATAHPDEAARAARIARTVGGLGGQAGDGARPTAATPAADAARAERDRQPAASAERGATEAASVASDESRGAETDETEPADGASGPATLAHWLQQTPAQRAAAAKGAVRAGVRDGATGPARAAAGGAVTGAAAEAGGAPRAAASPDGATWPGWASRDAGTGWVAGQWAAGGDASASSQGVGAGREGAAGWMAQDASASPVAADLAPPAVPAPGAESVADFAGQLAALMGGGSAASASALPADAPVQAEVRTPVGAPGFGDEVMVKVAALSQDGVQEAQLHLNPAELGPIQVRIAIDGGQARIDFGATAESTRQLLESALPALAQALQADGLQLGASSVGDLAPPIESDAAGSGAPLGGGQGEPSGQAGGRAGGWGQQNEAGAARAPSPADATGRPGEPLRAWAGAVASRPGSALRGLDLYA